MPQRLAASLRLHLDGLEVGARMAPRGPWAVSYGGRASNYPQSVTNGAGILIAQTFYGGGRPAPEAEYVARWNPEFTLGVIGFWRVLLDAHGPRVSDISTEGVSSREVLCWACNGFPQAPCVTLLNLAALLGVEA